MSTIVTRAGKGAPLTHTEVDANFTNLNTDKLEVGAAFNAAVAATPAVTANTAKVTNATHTGDVTGATALTIANDAVTNAKAANMATGTIKGRATAGTGDPEDLTGTQATTLLDTFVGSGAGHKKGLVPSPGATGGGTRYLNEDGTWTKRPYDLNLFVGGLTTNSELVFRMKTMTEFTLPASLTGSYGTAATASTGTVAFDLLKNGVSFGTLTFTASATGVFTAGTATTFAVGDVLTIVAPASADATLADVSINLKGSAT